MGEWGNSGNNLSRIKNSPKEWGYSGFLSNPTQKLHKTFTSMRAIIYFVFLLFFGGCSNNIRIEVSDVVFEKEEKVAFKKIETDFLFSYPVSLLLTDSLLIVQDERGHSFFFHALHRKSWDLQSEFATKGNAPGELLYPSYSPHIKDNTLQVFDYNMRCINFYEIEGSKVLFKNMRSFTRQIKNNAFIRQCIDIGDKYIATGDNGFFDQNQIALFDSSFNQPKTFERDLVLSSNKNENTKLKRELYNIYFLKTNPSMSFMVLASYKIGVLEIFDLEKDPDNVRKINSLILTPPLDQENNTIYGFEDVFVTDNYIYALHNGKSAKENPLLAKNIKVFDKSGDPVVQYNVGVDMRCLAVDEKQNIIYAIAYTEEEGFFLIEINITRLSQLDQSA